LGNGIGACPFAKAFSSAALKVLLPGSPGAGVEEVGVGADGVEGIGEDAGVQEDTGLAPEEPFEGREDAVLADDDVDEDAGLLDPVVAGDFATTPA